MHYGRAAAVRARRANVLNEAYALHPERFVRKPPQPPAIPTAVWINEPKEEDAKRVSAAASFRPGWWPWPSVERTPCWTWEISPYTTSVSALSGKLLDRLEEGMLCLADRGCYRFEAWKTPQDRGGPVLADADLCLRMKDNVRLESVKDLPDGSWLADVLHSTKDRTRRVPVTVRVSECTIEDARQTNRPTPVDHHTG